ncbi:MAG: hypothetical protein U0271_38255 [Polyangiaceae bacterium]
MSRSGVLAVAFLAGCGSAQSGGEVVATPPGEGGTASASGAPSSREPQSLSLVHAGLARPDAVGLPTKSAPVVTHDVRLPVGLGRILDITSLDQQSLWLLSADGTVIEQKSADDSASVGRPTCWVESCCGRLIDCSKQPKLCNAKYAASCNSWEHGCSMSVDFQWLEARDNSLYAGAVVETGGLRGSLVEARLARDGKWVCEQNDGDSIEPGQRARGDRRHVRVAEAGGFTFQLEPNAVLVNPIGRATLTVEGRAIALPSRFAGDLLVVAPDDLWVSDSTSLYRGNGFSWTEVPIPANELTTFWRVGDTVWVLGNTRGSDEIVAGYDLGTNSWRGAATPTAAAQVETKDGFWLIGKKVLYRWDGKALVDSPIPITASKAYALPTGELWVAGYGATELQTPVVRRDDDVPENRFAGALIRVSP